MKMHVTTKLGGEFGFIQWHREYPCNQFVILQ